MENKTNKFKNLFSNKKYKKTREKITLSSTKQGREQGSEYT